MIATNNSLMHGMRGTIGRLMFRNVQGRTVVSTRRLKLTRAQKQQQSELQRENRTRFRKASAYAKAMMLEPRMKEYYWQKARKLRLPNGYTAAIADFMRKTSVQSVNTKRYTGKAGGHISIKAGKKDFAIAGVTVTLATKEGVEIEKGIATRCASSGEWIYRNAAAATSPENIRITVETRDRMGNRSTVTAHHGSRYRRAFVGVPHQQSGETQGFLQKNFHVPHQETDRVMPLPTPGIPDIMYHCS